MTAPALVPIAERVEWIQQLVLSAGVHDAPDDPDGVPRACSIPEGVAWCFGLRWCEDDPGVSCSTIEAVLGRVNDAIHQAGRDAVGRWVFGQLERLAVTGGDGLGEARSFVAADEVVRTMLPLWLEVVDQHVVAVTVRGLPAIVDRETAQAAWRVVHAARDSLGQRAMLAKQLMAAIEGAVHDGPGSLVPLGAVLGGARAVVEEDVAAVDAAVAADGVDVGALLEAPVGAAVSAFDVADLAALTIAARRANRVGAAAAAAAVTAAAGVGSGSEPSALWTPVYVAVKARVREVLSVELDVARARCFLPATSDMVIRLLERLASVRR